MTNLAYTTDTVELVRVEVGKNAGGCGHVFYMTRQHYDTTRNSKSLWFCPVCGVKRLFTGKSESDLLRELLEEEKRRTEFAQNNAKAERQAREHTERQLTARKGVNTRLRNRIKHGVCPCCHRTFTNIARHMQTQHPGFNQDDGT